jgi:hypothetical protein
MNSSHAGVSYLRVIIYSAAREVGMFLHLHLHPLISPLKLFRGTLLLKEYHPVIHPFLVLPLETILSVTQSRELFF